MKINHWMLLSFFIFLIGACSAPASAPQGLAGTTASFTVTPSARPAAPTSIASISPATSAPARPTPTAHTSTPNAAPKPILSPTSTSPVSIQKMLGDQVVQINAQEIMTVRLAEFLLTGLAPSGSVVSVNHDFTVVGANRAFSFPITLEEGPNLLEVVVSSPQGQQVDIELVVVFDPSS